MTLTVKASWNLRKKLVRRPRTYAQALAIWDYSMQVSQASKSQAGGHHLGIADVHVRQYPLVLPYWSRTYVGKLPCYVNASCLDNTMYTSNDQVPSGRIAFFYAGSGLLQTNSLELVCWHPDGRCIINPVVMETYQWGRQTRAADFSGTYLSSVQQRACIKTVKKGRGGMWKEVKLPMSNLRENDYRRHNEIKDDTGTGTGMYNEWQRDYSNLFIWDRWMPLVIPSKRRERPYILRGVIDAHLDNAGYEPPPRLTSWSEDLRVRKRRARVHMKMAGIVRSMALDSSLVDYFLRMYRRRLGLEDAYQPTAYTTPDQSSSSLQPGPAFLDAGERHSRRVFLDETMEEEN